MRKSTIPSSYFSTMLLPAMFFLLACWGSLYGQVAQIIELRNLPSEGLLLNSGWKYQVGDNAQWADVDFNDGDWDTVDPTPDIHELPMLWKNSIVWLRLHLNIDSSLVGNIAMSVQHAGASEIYLDGNLIQKFGVVSSNPDDINAYNPRFKSPQSLPVSYPGYHVLAVCYTLEPNVLYTTMWANFNPGLRIKVNTYENAQQFYYDDKIFGEISSSFRVSAYLLLTIIFLAFYVSNRKLKTNLLFFVYTLTWTVVWKAFEFAPATVKHYFYFASASLILQIFGLFVYVTAIYNLFDHRKNWIFYFLIAFGLISIPLGILFYNWGWQVFGILFIGLVDAEILRVSVLSLRRGVKGAGIIVIGSIICLITWVLFNLSYLVDLSFIFYTWYFFNLHHLSIPVAVSIYLGYDLGLINRSLENNLNDIKVLSAEKEQILTSQNERLEEQVTERTSELQQTIKDLKSSQSQLIQSEKMASLGELTAGIAHEIQNPLNFVNNFSEVSSELVSELNTEIEKGNTKDAKEIAGDLKQNLEKINHHGKRAADIVKGMLQHSRTSSGQKELTDINALADEYLRLAYHGLRAKDKSFNAKFETHLDPTLPKVSVVPQDIGRVILNLINNAFYAVSEKQKVGSGKSVSGYEPTVTVSTRNLGDKIEISVKDNGNGIPDSIKEKIFQPFFTTKPTGQGTGLGLSLSYDIVKAHSGEITVETIEGKGTQFTLQLPVS